MVEIYAEKCTFWVQIVYKIHVSQILHLSAHFTFGSCQKIQSINKVMRKFIRLLKNGLWHELEPKYLPAVSNAKTDFLIFYTFPHEMHQNISHLFLH